MIDLHDIRILDSVPWTAKRYVTEIRFIDPSKGRHITEYGFEIFNYDKCVNYQFNRLDYGLRRASKYITERLCV